MLTTHNRPDLLLESVGSVLAQSYPHWELIIVDDGSNSPATTELIGAAQFSNRIRIIRHPEARGLSAARNSGIEAATGDFVTFLDDDDLLTNNALQEISKVLVNNRELDCLFLSIEPFGPLAEGTRENQGATLARVLEDLGITMRTGTCPIPDNQALFVALLKRLPMAFQRPVVRKQSLLSRVGEYTGRQFGDLEWNYRVVLRCQCALLLDAVYLVRCQGQSYFSRIDAKAKMLDTLIKIRQALLILPEVKAIHALSNEVKKALSAAHFEKAYFAYTCAAPFPWADFVQSLRSGINWSHLSLLAKVSVRFIASLAKASTMGSK